MDPENSPPPSAVAATVTVAPACDDAVPSCAASAGAREHIIGGPSSSSPAFNNYLPPNPMSSECEQQQQQQHDVALRRNFSQKRLRGEEDGRVAGRLKCEEDYDDTTSNNEARDDGRVGEAEKRMIDGMNENDDGSEDASDAMEENEQPALDDVDIMDEPAPPKPPNGAPTTISNSDESGQRVAATTTSPSSINKRKGTPRKLPPEEVGLTQPMTERPIESNGGDEDKSNGSGGDDDDDDESIDSDSSSSSSSSSSLDEDEAALIASLLHGGNSDALRAYLAGHGSFDASDMEQRAVPSMPPPSFPNGMAEYLNSPACKSIVVLAGAGMSVSSGIPDFRSAGSGLYDTLRPELLTATEEERALIEDDPTLALDKGMFLRNPLPMLETKRDFILGTYEKRWKATLAHRFVELLHSRLGKLTRLYTQNIDGLELQTTLPKEKVICVHGTMGAAACERCGHEADFDYFCNEVRSNIKDISGQDADAPARSSPIVCDACKAPTVKPTIVLFRGSMPSEFHVRTAQDLPDCDLLIIMGTSLTVAPANSLVYRIPPTAFRMVMNNERVGRRLGIDYGENSLRDVWAEGYTDETCLDLCERMGWLDDLARTVDDLPDSSARLLQERLARRQQQQEEDEGEGMS